MSLAVAATGILGYTDVAATNGKVVTVGSVTYTLKTGALAAAGDVAIVAGKPDSTLRNLANAINGYGGVVGTDYYTITANAAARAQHDPFDNAVVITARVAGTAGNLIALATDEPTFTVPGTTLAGGVAGDSILSYSLLSLEEARVALRVRGDSADAELVLLLAQVADIVEEELGFRAVADIGSSEPEEDVDEYHDLANPQGFIYLRRRPIRTITSVYSSGSLVPPTNYVVDYKSGLVTFVGAMVTPVRRPLGGFIAGPFVDWPEDSWRTQSVYFPAGSSAARALYKGGFADTASVVGGIKAVAIDILARLYQTRERKSQGVTSIVGPSGSLATKYDPRVISEDVRGRLRAYATMTTTARQ